MGADVGQGCIKNYRIEHAFESRMILHRDGNDWVDVPAWDRCPACGVDWRPKNSYMRSWLPCGCAPPANGHRVYLCKECGVTSRYPPHDVDGFRDWDYPAPRPSSI
jgi:hypothetical protein